jgi:quinohemoprotein ethanol dehydrogenase
MRIFRLTCPALAVVILTLAGATWLPAQKPAKAPNVDGKLLRDAGNVAKDALPGSWLSYGRNQSETRYSTLKQINDTNATRLGLAWTYAVGAGGGNQEGTPLVWNNTLYGITTWSVVYALDAGTGKELWRWDPEVNQTAVRPKICCGIVNRGLAIYNALIIAPINDGRLQALDALTGKPVWESRVAYPQDFYTLTMAPRIAGDKVIVGVSGGDKPTRGFFAAFDAKTGQQSWKFYTVPGNPESPPENDAMKAALKTWGGDFWTKGGGGAVWDGIALRSRGEPGIRRNRQRRALVAEIPRRSGRGQPLYLFDLGGGPHVGAAQVALPDHAQRQLGLRQRAAVNAARPEHQRQGA